MAGSSTGWEPGLTDRPHPPANVHVVSPYIPGCFDIRWDDPSTLNTGPATQLIQATGSIVVGGTPELETTATGAFTVLQRPVPTTHTLQIDGTTLFSRDTARTPGLNDYQGNLATTSLVAQNMADAINDASNGFSDSVEASVSGNTVNLTAEVSGSAGNSIGLASSDTAFVSVTKFTGGQDAAFITIAGRTLTAVSGTRTSGANDFSTNGTNFDIAESIAAAINDPNNSFSSYVSATAEYGEVSLTAQVPGAMGNDIVLTTNSNVITLSGERLTGGLGTLACAGKSNSQWSIVGVNIYRSQDGERGPFVRVNPYPITSTFYRDCTTNILVEDEIVDWDNQWISKGDMSKNRKWRFRTRRCPVVKEKGQAVNADSPTDVIVKIDGVTVPVNAVFGPDGEIDLINVPTYDPSTEKVIQPVLPKEDGSSVVTVTYYRKGNFVRTDLDSKYKLHYRVTTVAIDPSGTTPSGYVETPLGYAPPASPMNVESLDYIWREAIKRNRWILEQGGERVKLFLRKVVGVKCPCHWDPRLLEYSEQPLNNCPECFGVGILGGYEGPIDIIIGPGQGQQSIRQTPNGRKREHVYDVWMGPTPLISQRDFIVKQNGDRYSIGPVEYTEARGALLQQAFQIGVLDQCDIRYKVPVLGTTELAWPETRFTRPELAECVDSEPYPVGYDYQAGPMATEAGKIADGREQRGRTPVFQNITYGGGGGS